MFAFAIVMKEENPLDIFFSMFKGFYKSRMHLFSNLFKRYFVNVWTPRFRVPYSDGVYTFF